MKKPALFLMLLLGVRGASAAESPVRISLGAMTHVPAPSGEPIQGSDRVQFFVRVTNISGHPVWFKGSSFNAPFYRVLTQPIAGGSWTDYGMHFFAPGGIKAFALIPAETMTSSFFIPAWYYIGQPIRIEMEILSSAQTLEPMPVSSGAMTIN